MMIWVRFFDIIYFSILFTYQITISIFILFRFVCLSIENDRDMPHNMRVVDDMEADDDMEEDEPDDEHDDKMLDGRKLRKRLHQPFFCEDDGESSGAEHEDDADDADGPENLCIKNNRGSHSDGVSNNNNNKDNNSSSNSNSNNHNRIGLGELLYHTTKEN